MGSWLGKSSTIANAERWGIGLTCADQDTDMLFIRRLQSSPQDRLNIRMGCPPDRFCGQRLKEVLTCGGHFDTTIPWLRVPTHKHPGQREGGPLRGIHFHIGRGMRGHGGGHGRGRQSGVKGHSRALQKLSRVRKEEDRMALTGSLGVQLDRNEPGPT